MSYVPDVDTIPQSITRLDLSHIPLTNDQLKQIVIKLDQLEELCLSRTGVSFEGVEFSKSLRKLSVANCKDVTNDALSHAIKNCSKDMEKLNISTTGINCSGITFSALRDLNASQSDIGDDELRDITSSCENLEILNLEHTLGIRLERISLRKSLKKLNITECYNITDETLENAIKDCVHLEHFLCEVRLDLTFENIVFTQSLKSLGLYGVTGRVLMGMIKDATKLEELSWYKFPDFGLEGVLFPASLRQLDLDTAIPLDELEKAIVNCKNFVRVICHDYHYPTSLLAEYQQRFPQ